jgi:hypothetical protein
MRKTSMMITPSLEEVELAAAKIGLPPVEAAKFFNYYSSNGWRVGKNKMVSFTHALANWKLIWQERQRPQPMNGKKHWAEVELERIDRELAGDNF